MFNMIGYFISANILAATYSYVEQTISSFVLSHSLKTKPRASANHFSVLSFEMVVTLSLGF